MTDWLTEAARRPLQHEVPETPDGLVMIGGKLMFQCRSCDEWVEWPCDPEEFDIDSPINLCGGSPRCCP